MKKENKIKYKEIYINKINLNKSTLFCWFYIQSLINNYKGGK